MSAFDGQTVVVTGGGQGIGRSYCEWFGARGGFVVVADVVGDHAESVAKDIVGSGGSAVGVTVDVSDEASVRAMVGSIREQTGRLDVLVNNAAIFSTLERRSFLDIEAAEWSRLMAVNEMGVFLCCKHMAPVMQAGGYGRIVNISSVVVRMGAPDYLHYVTSKAGVIGMTRSLARELGPSGITVNAVMPGPVLTEVEREWFRTDADFDRAAAAQQIKRVAVPEDMCAAVGFFASPEAGFITGQSLAVDGGRTFG